MCVNWQMCDLMNQAINLQSNAQGVVRLTMNRPDNFNALSEEMLTALQGAFDQIAADPQARVVLLAGAGKAFCPGHHLAEMSARPELTYYQQLFAQCSRLMLSIQQLPLPVIARVHGVATAAGCQLVAQCDLAVAASTARFAVSGVNFGLFCSTPSVALVRNMLPKQAMEMLLTGDFIDAATALSRGLVNRVVPPEQLDAEIDRLVASILDKPREAIAIGKSLFYQQREMGVAAAYQLAGQAMAVNMMEASAQEGFAAFVEKRQPAWRHPSGGST